MVLITFVQCFKIEVFMMEVITRKKYHRKVSLFRKSLRLFLVTAVLLMACAVGLLTYAKIQGPPPLEVEQTMIIYGSDNSILGQKHSGQNRHWISLDEISPHVIDATLAIEDRKFYSHHGFDFIRIGSAVLTNLRNGTKAQGASTITQQYARNLYLSHEKTWQRKWNEAMYAIRLELHYSKNQILEGYLNTIYYGHGAYGIEAASRYYFQKSASDLNLAEATILAGIPKGPFYYSPVQNYERSKGRQKLILDAMVEQGKITRNAAKKAYEVQLEFKKEEKVTGQEIAPYFQDIVFQELVETYKLDPKLIENGGLRIYTTLDPNMQKIAEEIIAEELKDKELLSALVAIDPRNGDVKALVGGRNYEESEFNLATQAQRPPGSTFKPFLYLAALENGMTAATPLLSEETTFITEGEEDYTPKNFGNSYANDFITLAKAIALSDNIYAVKTHHFLGFDSLITTAEKLGIKSKLGAHPSLALGSYEVNVLELTTSYSPFANGGKKVKPRFITKVIDRNGNVIIEQEPVTDQVIKPELAYIMTDLMTGMFSTELNDIYASVTGHNVIHLLDSKRPVAGKSGTTSTDSWMIGYTPQLLTGVWTGYEIGRKLDATQGDSRHSKRIWAKYTKEVLENEPRVPFDKPGNIVQVAINPNNGRLATENCPVRHIASFVKGTEPTEYCQEHIVDGKQPIEDITEIEKRNTENMFDRFLKWFSDTEN